MMHLTSLGHLSKPCVKNQSNFHMMKNKFQYVMTENNLYKYKAYTKFYICRHKCDRLLRSVLNNTSMRMTASLIKDKNQA